MLSIIMPVKDGKEITRVAIDSIKNYTSVPYELIVVNDGSKKETSDFLRSLQGIVLIENKKSQGWCKAINQGIEKATGEFVVFSNNDVVVTPNWGRGMLKHFEIDSSLGVLGPTSSSVNGFQHIDYNREGVDFQYSDALMFFFTMVRKEVVDKIGGLDERFGIGGQDDTDYCIRANKADFKVGIARNVFVYHYGSATYRDIFHNDAKTSIEFAKSRQRILQEKYKGEIDRKKKVFVAIPNLGTIIPELATNLLQWTHDDRFEVKVFMPKNLQPETVARNSCVKQFLESDCDYLFWVDDDVSCPPETLHRLITHDKDVVAAIVFALKYDKDEVFTYPVALRYNENMEYKAYYGKGLEEVDAIGSACVLFKRKVFEHKELETPYEYQLHKDGSLMITPDFGVMQKVQKAGFKIFADFDLICSHVKEVDLKLLNNLLARMKNV